MTSTPIRVLAVDDHPLMLEGVAGVLRAEPDIVLVGEASSGDAAIARFRELRPDVTLMDMRLPGMPGYEAIARIVTEFPDARLLALTSYQGDADVARALRAGARGYLLKDMLRTDICAAIREVHAGRRVIPTEIAAKLNEHRGSPELTPREQQVLERLATGMRNRAIADELGVAEGTVKIHIERILMKLGAIDRTQAVTIAISRGLLRFE